jgi:ABC-type bacteriocin/lantibiotic exporter with double-glycine peptidase domain
VTLRERAAVLLAAAHLLAAPAARPDAPGAGTAIRLEIPALRQSPERCGPGALEMVMRYYGATGPALAEADRAYSPALHGSLITDLAAAARRAGYSASIELPSEDSLRTLMRDSIPPILLYQAGPGPLTRAHYGVLIGWDPARERYLVNDGGARPRSIARRELLRRWRSGGGQALIVAHETR